MRVQRLAPHGLGRLRPAGRAACHQDGRTPGDPDALERELGPPAATLRSRTGADSQLRVYPERGVAYATDGSSVEILEVFPPTTLDRYQAEIYEDPGEFIR